MNYLLIVILQHLAIVALLLDLYAFVVVIWLHEMLFQQRVDALHRQLVERLERSKIIADDGWRE